MNISDGQYLQLAHDLLEKACAFEIGERDDAVDDDDFIRTEVLQDFVEHWMERKISPTQAAKINELTHNPGNSEPNEVAAALRKVLDDV